jgi:hypothetical protein
LNLLLLLLLILSGAVGRVDGMRLVLLSMRKLPLIAKDPLLDSGRVVRQQLIEQTAKQLVKLRLQQCHFGLLLVLELIISQMNRPLFYLLLFLLSVVLVIQPYYLRKEFKDTLFIYGIVFFCVH